jgi:predicted RNase H-like HicB family nuclease
LIPDEDGYQAIVPHYGGVTWGKTPEDAFEMAKDALEATLAIQAEESGSDDPVPYNVHASHVVVGDVEVDVPEVLLTELKQVAVGAKHSSRKSARA